MQEAVARAAHYKLGWTRMSEPRLPAVRIGAPPIRGIEYAAVVAAILILVAFRLHAFDLPLETDESNYAYIAARLLAGDRLYVDVRDL